jgi:hypothetical protein
MNLIRNPSVCPRPGDLVLVAEGTVLASMDKSAISRQGDLVGCGSNMRRAWGTNESVEPSSASGSIHL